MEQTRMHEISVTDINEDLVKYSSFIVFDWDNTLKQYNPERRTIKSGVDREILLKWKIELKCKLFIISAIRPTKINLETILIEVERLGLTDVFTEKTDTAEIVPNKYARKGNVIICGYDKAETFLEIVENEANKQVTGKGDKTEGPDMLDCGPSKSSKYCMAKMDMLESGQSVVNRESIGTSDVKGSFKQINEMPVLFFDDEQVNIDNFSQMVQNSICYHIV